MFDLGPWLDPLEGANPSGESLRNDERFHEIERLMQPLVDASRDDSGDPAGGGSAPAIDWREVLVRAEDLRASGRDLRLLVIVVRALTNERGLAGFADGLMLIARNVEQHWVTLHPEMRPAPNPFDAARPRINAVMQLKSLRGVLGDLRGKVFFTVRGTGPITGRDLERATLDTRAVVAEYGSRLSPKEQADIGAAQEQLADRVRRACLAQSEQAPAELATIADEARAAIAALDALERALSENIGKTITLAPTSEETPAASPRHFLTRVLATVTRGAKGTNPTDPTAPEAGTPHDSGTQAGSEAVGSRVIGLPDRLNSREDVAKCLDLIITFYERSEPASPIPHLARRMRRMVPMDFLELMEDLAPSGLKEFRLLAGATESRKSPTKDER